MLNKSTIIGTVVNFIWAFMGGYLLWGILAEDFMNSHLGTATGVSKVEPDFGLLALGCFILAFAFTVIYKKWGNGDYSISNGIIFGVWIGILRGFGSGIIELGTTNTLDMTAGIVNGIIYTVFFVVMGILSSIIQKKLN